MKKLIIGTLVLLLSCAPKTEGKRTIREDATEYNFVSYSGKTIKSMRYCDGCGSSGDLLILEFTDGTRLKVYAYKYNMKIEK
jgi:hypothetical protein